MPQKTTLVLQKLGHCTCGGEVMATDPDGPRPGLGHSSPPCAAFINAEATDDGFLHYLRDYLYDMGPQ